MSAVLLLILAALPLAQVLLGRLVLGERAPARRRELPVAEVGPEALRAMAARAFEGGTGGK